jgi:hypothetical protein
MVGYRRRAQFCFFWGDVMGWIRSKGAFRWLVCAPRLLQLCGDIQVRGGFFYWLGCMYLQLHMYWAVAKYAGTGILGGVSFSAGR